MSERIKLNIGGSYHEITKSTLMTYPNTLLATMLTEHNSSLAKKDEDGRYFFDRNPLLFPFVLDFYRAGKVVFPKLVGKDDFVEELRFWGIDVELTIEEKMPTLNDIVNYAFLPYTVKMLEGQDTVNMMMKNPKNFMLHAEKLLVNIETALKKGQRIAYAIFPLLFDAEITRCFNFKTFSYIYANTAEYPNNDMIVTFEGSNDKYTSNQSAYNGGKPTGVKVTF